MKFSCEKSSLLYTVNIASRAAAVKSAVQSLEGLLIEADESITISSYDLRTGIRSVCKADVSERGSVVLNAKLFGDIVRRLPDDVVTITVSENYMTNIRCGMSEFNIMGLSAADYPELPSVDDRACIYMQEKVLKAMISQTNFAVSDNESRPIHTGELFELEGNVLTMVAVDGYRLALRREAVARAETESVSFVVPGNALSEVEKIAGDSEDLVRIVPGSKHILFEIGKTTLISRRLEGEVLNYKNSIPKVFKYSVEVETRDLLHSTERVSLIINDKLKSPVRYIFADHIIKLYSATPLGKAYDECRMTGDADNLEIGFNNKYMMDVLKAVPSNNIRLQLSTGIAPCVIVSADESRNFIYMVLPVRLRANED